MFIVQSTHVESDKIEFSFYDFSMIYYNFFKDSAEINK
jgi:hypothetical protein